MTIQRYHTTQHKTTTTTTTTTGSTRNRVTDTQSVMGGSDRAFSGGSERYTHTSALPRSSLSRHATESHQRNILLSFGPITLSSKSRLMVIILRFQRPKAGCSCSMSCSNLNDRLLRYSVNVLVLSPAFCLYCCLLASTSGYE